MFTFSAGIKNTDRNLRVRSRKTGIDFNKY